MSPADEARANALPCEMVKYALRQTRDGIVVSFVVHPNDMPAALQTSHIGSRWMAALVQIGDNELPVQQPAKDVVLHPQVKAKRQWEELQPQQQAGIRCEERAFATFLFENHKDHYREALNDPAECVRLICGVESRAELGKNQRARVLWHRLDDAYQAWLMVAT